MPDTTTTTSTDTSNGASSLGSWLTTLGNLGTAGANAYKTVAGGSTPAAAKPATSITTYLPWIIGGVVALVVLMVVLKRK